MILGGEPLRELSAGLQKVSINLSQQISFNSVKQKRQEGTQKFRHSKSNEPLLPALIGPIVHARTEKRKLVDQLAAEDVSISYDRVMNFLRSRLYPTRRAWSTKPVSENPEPPVSSDIDPDSFFLDGSASVHPNEWLLKLAAEPEDVKHRISFLAYFPEIRIQYLRQVAIFCRLL